MIYYRVHDFDQETWTQWVVKINPSNPDRLTAAFISPAMENVGSFFVNTSEDVIYPGRIIMSEGGLVNTPAQTGAFWPGSDDEFYTIQYMDHNQLQILKLTIEYNQLVTEEYGPVKDYSFWHMDMCNILRLQEKVFMSCRGDLGGNIYEVFNATDTPHRVEGLGIITAHNAVASDNHYYVSGNDEANRPARQFRNSERVDC